MSEKGTLEDKIAESIKTIKRTRLNRISLSERLKKYSNRWKVILFILNIEAVFLIFWTLNNNMDIPNSKTTLISSFFAIYVILLQYFINEQSFSERSLKTHYHQLELRDLIIKLEVMTMKLRELKNTSSNKSTISNEYKEMFLEYEKIMNKYQLSLKNNENHSKRDDLLNQIRKNVKGYILYDSSLENIFIIFNLIISIAMIFYIVVLFVEG